MAFDRQNITNQGFYLLKKVKDGCSLSFTSMFVEQDTVAPSQMPNGGGLTYEQAVGDTERFRQGVMWSVTPIKSYIGDNGNLSVRAVGKFNTDVESELVVRTAYLFASVVDEHGDLVIEDGTPLENVLFAVASNNNTSVLQGDGKNSLYVTFSVVLTNGFSSIIGMENGVATLQDLESLQAGANIQKLTIKFDENTKDLQLFDADGNLIDQANIGAISGNDDAVTVHNPQYVFGEKIWVDPAAIQRPCKTVYVVTEGDESHYIFVSGLDAVIEELASPDEAATEQYKSNVKAFEITAQDGRIVITQLEKTFEECQEIASGKVVRRPKVTDFFIISDDRDPETVENIGQDKVRTGDGLTNELAAILWQGYGQVIATDPSCSCETLRQYAIFPNTISVEDINALIPPIAIDPADFKAVYTNGECEALKLKYQALGELEVNGVQLQNATRNNLFRVLKGLYERQVSGTRDAYAKAEEAWDNTLYLDSNRRMTFVGNDGITLSNENQFYNIGLEKESNADDEKQKIALSRKIFWNDNGVQKNALAPFAFIGDSGMLGGAPLFTVRILTAAHYIRGTKNWLLNSIQCSDGFKAELCGQLKNNITNPSNSELDAHLLVSCADNLKLRPFTSVVVEIDGYTGVNHAPVSQHKTLGCIVPFDVEKKHNPHTGSYGCDIDLTMPLNSWVQTDAQEAPLQPDIITVKAYICDTMPMEVPEISSDDRTPMVFLPFDLNGVTVRETVLYGAVYSDGTAEDALPTVLPEGVRVVVDGRSADSFSGYWWYRVIAVDEDGNLVDLDGNPTDTPVHAYTWSQNIREYEREIGEYEEFKKYARIPAGAQLYVWNEESDDVKYGSPLTSSADVIIDIHTQNSWYGIADTAQDSGYVFVKDNEPGLILDSLMETFENKEHDMRLMDVPVHCCMNPLYEDAHFALFDGELAFPYTNDTNNGHSASGLLKDSFDDSLNAFYVCPDLPWPAYDSLNRYYIARRDAVDLIDDSDHSSYTRVKPFTVSDELVRRLPQSVQYNRWSRLLMERPDLIDKYYETDDKIGIGFTLKDSVREIYSHLSDYDGSIFWCTKALMTITPAVLEPYEDTTITPMDRFATGNSVVNKYERPLSDEEPFDTIDLSEIPYLRVSGTTANGFARIDAVPEYYVRLSDITLSLVDTPAEDETYTVVASEDNPVTYYRGVMPDSTLVSPVTVTEGTFTCHVIKGKSVLIAQYRESEDATEEIQCYLLSTVVALRLTEEDRRQMIQDIIRAQEDFNIYLLDGNITLPQAAQTLDVDDSSVVVLDRGAQVRLIGQAADAADAEQNNSNSAPVSGEGD